MSSPYGIGNNWRQKRPRGRPGGTGRTARLGCRAGLGTPATVRRLLCGTLCRQFVCVFPLMQMGFCCG